MEIKNIRKAINTMLLADAYCMPLHWNYNHTAIDQLVQSKKIDLSTLNSGEYNSYYQNKLTGSQSHYGDQILHLYHYLLKQKTFDVEHYKSEWKSFIYKYQWYKDKSTQTAMEHIEFGIHPSGADSTDCCGVSYGIPALILHPDNMEKSMEYAIARSKITHNTTLVSDTMYWIMLASESIHQQVAIPQAMLSAAKHINNPVFQDIFSKGEQLAYSDKNTRQLITESGLGCSIENNVPFTIALLYKYHQDFNTLIRENALAGSDSCSRALIMGFLIGMQPYFTPPLTLQSKMIETLL